MSKYNLKGFAPKDAKIIKQNSDKTPYELLALGISHKAYERLLEQEPTPTKEDNTTVDASMVENTEGKLQPTKVEKVEYQKATDTKQISKAVQNSSSVRVKNIETGKVISTSQYFAKILIRNGKHQIV